MEESLSSYLDNKLFSVIFIIVNLFKDYWVSNGVNTLAISSYLSEREILFLPFPFYYVMDVYIDNNNYAAEILLE